MPNVVIRSGSGTPAISKMELFKFHRSELDLRQTQACSLDPRSFSKIWFWNYHIDSYFSKSQLNWTRWQLLAPNEKLLYQILYSKVELFATIIYSWQLLTTVAKTFNLCYLMTKWWVNKIKLRVFTEFKRKVLFANIRQDYSPKIFPKIAVDFK